MGLDVVLSNWRFLPHPEHARIAARSGCPQVVFKKTFAALRLVLYSVCLWKQAFTTAWICADCCAIQMSASGLHKNLRRLAACFIFRLFMKASFHHSLNIKPSVSLKVFLCPGLDSNQHILANAATWTQCVYQFRHLGIQGCKCIKKDQINLSSIHHHFTVNARWIIS